MKKTVIVAATSAAALLALAGCGQQTDERVATSSAAAPASSAAASAAASASGVKASVEAATPYVTVDCTSLQAMPTDQPPAQGTTVGDVTAILQPNGAPSITIATNAQPATELGTAEMQPGSGPEVKAGDTVTANYCGVGLGSRTVFDSSWSRGTPATFPLTGVIQGWQEGVPGMKVGGTRLLVIPGELAYGTNPPPGIGANETLIFVVQITAIN